MARNLKLVSISTKPPQSYLGAPETIFFQRFSPNQFFALVCVNFDSAHSIDFLRAHGPAGGAGAAICIQLGHLAVTHCSISLTFPSLLLYSTELLFPNLPLLSSPSTTWHVEGMRGRVGCGAGRGGGRRRLGARAEAHWSGSDDDDILIST
jgi:hypothetical protein